MRADVFQLMASHEDRHWWFAGRRAVISALLDRVDCGASPRILEVGCGTGGNVALLTSRGDLEVMEPDPTARRIALDRFPDLKMHQGAVPKVHALAASSYDLVLALDVLEHVDDDLAALQDLVELTRPGAWILVTVPAHPILFGSHDVRLDHKRRYTRKQMERLCRDSGAETVFVTAFNTLLAPLAVAYRLLEKLSPVRFPNQERVPPGLINAVFSRVFAAESAFIRYRAIPLGLSLGILLRRGPPRG